MLRAAVKEETPLGRKAKEVMDSGNLVSDDIILGIIKERLTADDCKEGCLFDGFPRTIAQAEALDREGITINHVIEIRVEDSDIIQRMSGRRVHPASGRTYHLTFTPPQQPGIDDETGEPLIQRVDDTEETVKKRLAIYHEQTSPLIEYYTSRSKEASNDSPQFTTVEGTGKVEEIRDRILKALGA